MKNRINPSVLALEPSGIRKFFDVAHEIPDVISLGVGEPDFDTPWHIRESGIAALRGGKTFYTSNAGLTELREEISRYTEKQLGIHYDPKSEILVTVGGSEGIDAAIRTIVSPGDEVLYTEPCFVCYKPCVALAGGVPVPLSLREEDEFRLRAADLDAAVTDKTRALIISFPNNPTGAILEKEDLEAIAEVVIRRDLLVISDEIYADLTYKGKHVSIASLPGMRDRTIVINGFSKAFAMTGWRLGYAMGPADILKQMTKIHQFAIMCAPTVSQYAAVEAMKNGENDVVMMRDSYNQRRRFLLHEFEKLGIPCFPPYGAFYIFPNISEFGMTSDEFATRLLHEEKVAVIPGTAFGRSGEGHLRVSYAYSIEELKNAMVRFSRFVRRLREEKDRTARA